MGEPRQPYQLRIEQEFRAADIDGDEQLTPEEYRAGWPNDEVAFETLDTDANGRLSLAELMAYADWRRIANRPLDPRWY